MIKIQDCGYKAGYSGNDHLLDDSALKQEIGRNFKSVREIERTLNKIAAKTLHWRCATPPIWVEIDGDRLGKTTISV
jgi:hypothetical protein